MPSRGFFLLLFLFSFLPSLSSAGPPLSERSSPPHGLISISDARSARHPRSPRRAAGPAAPLTAADGDQLAHRCVAVLSLCCPCRCPVAVPPRCRPSSLSVSRPVTARSASQPSASVAAAAVAVATAPPANSSATSRRRDWSVPLAPAAVAAAVATAARRLARRAPLASARLSLFCAPLAFFFFLCRDDENL